MKKLLLTAFVLLSLVFLSQAQTKHTIGEKFGGGIVFDVSADGLHGIIVETIDQGMYAQWGDVHNKLNDKQLHSDAGKAFTDWRLPTEGDWKKLCGNPQYYSLHFVPRFYWSSSMKNDKTRYFQDCGPSELGSRSGRLSGYKLFVPGLADVVIRTVRDF